MEPPIHARESSSAGGRAGARGSVRAEERGVSSAPQRIQTVPAGPPALLPSAVCGPDLWREPALEPPNCDVGPHRERPKAQ